MQGFQRILIYLALAIALGTVAYTQAEAIVELVQEQTN